MVNTRLPLSPASCLATLKPLPPTLITLYLATADTHSVFHFRQHFVRELHRGRNPPADLHINRAVQPVYELWWPRAAIVHQSRQPDEACQGPPQALFPQGTGGHCQWSGPGLHVGRDGVVPLLQRHLWFIRAELWPVFEKRAEDEEDQERESEGSAVLPPPGLRRRHLLLGLGEPLPHGERGVSQRMRLRVKEGAGGRSEAGESGCPQSSAQRLLTQAWLSKDENGWGMERDTFTRNS